MPISNLYNLINATDQNISQFKGLTAAYSLLGGVPTIAGYTFLINQNNTTNFGAGGNTQFNDENIYINTVNALYQGNARARANFDAIVSAGETPNDRLSLIYDHIIPEAARTDAGRAYFLSQAEFYTARAAELDIEGDNGAAVVAFASLMKIAVDNNIDGLGTSINNLIEAVDDETAQIPEDGDILTTLEDALDNPTFTLTSGIDKLIGTSDNDLFDAPPSQNPSLGGLSNTLSSADSIDGGAGRDRLHAEITQEFIGATGFALTDIQPTITSVEVIDIEVRDYDEPRGPQPGDILPLDFVVTLDAKDITGHEEIGSYRSDGDLVIENLNTLDSDGNERPTADITITMDHTDNSNSDGDASDLTVYFDDNYLITGTRPEGDNAAVFFLTNNAFNGRSGTTGSIIDALAVGQSMGRSITIPSGPPNSAGFNNFADIVTATNSTLASIPTLTSKNSNAAMGLDIKKQADLDMLLDILELDSAPIGTSLADLMKILGANTQASQLLNYAQQANQDVYILRITSSNDANKLNGGFNFIDGAPGFLQGAAVYDTSVKEVEVPISVDIDLFKVGRGGDGGKLIVGAKSQDEGIEVFNVHVKGGEDKPSNLQSLDSTGNALRTINIETHEDYREGGSEYVADSFADLTIREGSTSDLTTINADEFLGDLTLGSGTPFINVDRITAKGGGDVAIYHEINKAGEFNISTGRGDDKIDQTLKFDNDGFGDTVVSISTGAGDDVITLDFEQFTQNAPISRSLNEPGTVEVDAGAGTDTISLSNSLNETVVLTGEDFGLNTVNDFETGNDASAGFDFLDFTAYLTSREDPAGEPPERSIAVTLDYQEDDSLDNEVAANEVAVVRMTDDAQDPAETFAALSAENVAALFNTTAGTAFGGDESYGDLSNSAFRVKADYVGDALVGNAKAVLLVDNAADVGNYKVFELTWSGRAGSEDDVEVAELGILDFGDTALAGLEEENLVGTSQYDNIA